MKKMKMNNKGFSLVELIIVIAIMAILAGALAPALIKYIAKSRRTADVNNANTIVTAVNGALNDETAYDELVAKAGNGTSVKFKIDATNDKVEPSVGDNFDAIVKENVSGGLKGMKVKSTKDKSGTKITGTEFYVSVDVVSSEVKVTIGDGSGENDVECYPNSSNMK